MATKEKEKKYFNLGDNWSVRNVRDTKYGTFFTLCVEGAAFYSLRVVPAGKNYDAFISMPEDKAENGEYYKRFAIYFNEDDAADIIAAVHDALDDEPRKKRK